MVSGLSISDRPEARLLRPVAYTNRPARASSTAMARPAPRVAPATKATRPPVVALIRSVKHPRRAPDPTEVAARRRRTPDSLTTRRAPQRKWPVAEIVDEPGSRDPGLSACRGANLGNTRHTSTVNRGRQARAEPYWRRRVLLLAGVIAVIGIFVWSCSPQDPAQKPPRQTAAAATSSAAQPSAAQPTESGAAPASVRATASPEPTAKAQQTSKAQQTPKPRPTGRKRAGVRAHSQGSGCAPGDVVITLLESQQSYQQPAEPRFTIYVVNTAGRTCTFDAGPRSLRLVVESGPVHEWSPADCVHHSNSGIVRLAQGVPFTKHVSWNRLRSAPGCASSGQAALPGTYTATVTYGAVHSQTAVFSLR